MIITLLYYNALEVKHKMGKDRELASFAGGCCWCMVKPFDQWEGVHEVLSGYIGGHVENPSYEDVKAGDSGHYEAVQITFDSRVISYETLLDLFWQQIDPTDDGGQFHDRGDSYRTAIFYHTAKQKELAKASKEALDKSGKFSKPVVTEILEASTFYPAEDYHQDFYKKNEKEYLIDRKKSGRDAFISEYWKSK